MLTEMIGEIAYAAAGGDMHSINRALETMMLGSCHAETIMNARRRFKRDSGTLEDLPPAKVDPLIAIAEYNRIRRGY